MNFKKHSRLVFPKFGLAQDWVRNLELTGSMYLVVEIVIIIWEFSLKPGYRVSLVN